MCEQTPFSYQSGQVVWVKLGSCWWPGEARNYDELPEDARTSFKKVPVTVVQFFDEEKYEYVRNYDQVCLYNCKRKMEFIQRGLEMLEKHKNENFMNKFPSDVIRAEELTSGNPNIIANFTLKPGVRLDYNTIFGKNTKSTGKGRSPTKLKRRSLPAKQKVELSIILPDDRIPFGRHSDSALCHLKEDHTSVIRVQPRPEKVKRETNTVKNSTAEQMYACFMCDFKSKRIEGFMAHRKSHVSAMYGASRPQVITPKRNRRKSEGAGSTRRSSKLSSASPRAAVNKKHPLSSKSNDANLKIAESEFPKVDGSKTTVPASKGGKKKVALDEPESLEEKCSVKPPSIKKKTPRKRKNEDVFKTQLLADWDDEDPTLLEQEQERIKNDSINEKDNSNQKDGSNRKDSNWFDFVDSGDVMINKEHEERANRFARTRNIPVIPKPDTGAKKRRMEDFPSTSRDVLPSNKRPAEEMHEPKKRHKMSVVQDEEAYAKLLLDDAVPEFDLLLEAPLTTTQTDNNNTVMEESHEALIEPNLTASKEETIQPVTRMYECKNSEDIACTNELDTAEIMLSKDKESVHDMISETDADFTEGNCPMDSSSLKDALLPGKVQDDVATSSPTKEQTNSTKSEATMSCVLPEILEGDPLLAKPGETAFDPKELAAPIKENVTGALDVQELEHAGVSDFVNVADSVVIVSCDAEKITEHPISSKIKDDDEDMPEIICVEHRSPSKTVLNRGELDIENESEKIRKHEMKQNDGIYIPDSNELIDLNNTCSHQSVELVGQIKEAGNEIVSNLNESSGHSKDKIHDVRVSTPPADDDAAHVSEELEQVFSGDNIEEVTIIGYKSVPNADLKELEENISISAAGHISLESGSRDVPDSAELGKEKSHPISALSSDSALIKILEGSADDTSETEEICVDDDSSSTKEECFSTKATESSKADISREEIVADWSDEFDEDNHVVTPGKEKTIELIDLEKSENESEDAENEGGSVSMRVVADQIISGNAEVASKQDTEEEVMVLKPIPLDDAAKDDEMELDINSMPVVVEDAVIKDDGCALPSTSCISVLETSASTTLPPGSTTALPVLLGSATTAVKTPNKNIIVVSSPSQQLPQTARSVFASSHGKFVIMTERVKDKKLAPMLVANSSGLTTCVYTKSEQERMFKEGKKTLQYRGTPKIPVQTSKVKPLLPNIQNNRSAVDGPGIKILQSKGMLIPGTSLVMASSGMTTAFKVDPMGAQNIAGPRTMKNILVRRPAESKIVLPKNIPNLITSPSNVVPQDLKRLTNIFPLMKGSGSSTAKQLVISQPSSKPLKLQGLQSPTVQLFTKSQLQPLKKFPCQSSKVNLPLKSVPTTTIEISVSSVQTSQPAVTLAPTIQRGVNVSAIPKIPSSAIALPGTPVSTSSSLVVGSQDSPSFVFIVDPANIQQYDTSSNFSNYNQSGKNAKSQPVYLQPSSISSPGSLDGMVITLDDSSGNTAASSVLKLSENTSASSNLSGQDILATALANTQVFQSDSGLQDTEAAVGNEQAITGGTAVFPLQHHVSSANVPEVLETLSVTEPIMATRETPSVASVQNPPSSSSVSLHASLAASPSMPLLTDDSVGHVRSPTLELYENTMSQDAMVIQANLSEEPQIINDEGR